MESLPTTQRGLYGGERDERRERERWKREKREMKEESWKYDARAAEYFWRSSRCFIWWWNTVECLILLLKQNDFRRRNYGCKNEQVFIWFPNTNNTLISFAFSLWIINKFESNFFRMIGIPKLGIIHDSSQKKFHTDDVSLPRSGICYRSRQIYISRHDQSEALLRSR